MRKFMVVGVAAVAAAACATTAGSERVNKAAAQTLAEHQPTGKTERCISTSRISQMTAVDENTLLFRTGVNDYYVNKVKGRCNGATLASNRFEYRVSTAQLCSIDIINVVDSSGFINGTCSLGVFEELEPKSEAAE
ncbi:MAG: DUF6491 family protein [Pseudomonadota bacterium]|nr:DUF6491 family protein [Pseudomonadota bacterium]